MGKSLDPGVAVGAVGEVPMFECLNAGWVDDDVGLLFLMDKVSEGGNITRLRADLPAIVRRWTGTRSQVIS